MDIGMIIDRHEGQYIETISAVDLQPGLLVKPTTVVTDIGNFGLKVAPNDTATYFAYWVVTSRIFGDDDQERIVDHPIYTAGTLIRIAIMCSGSCANLRTNAVITKGSYINVASGLPGYVDNYGTFLKTVAVGDSTNGFVKVLFL
jgi:hypothetical protein